MATTVNTTQPIDITTTLDGSLSKTIQLLILVIVVVILFVSIVCCLCLCYYGKRRYTGAVGSSENGRSAKPKAFKQPTEVSFRRDRPVMSDMSESKSLKKSLSTRIDKTMGSFAYAITHIDPSIKTEFKKEKDRKEVKKDKEKDIEYLNGD